MKRLRINFVGTILLILFLVGCGSNLPDGVYEYGEHNYYVIALAPQNISNYFTLTGQTGTLMTTYIGGSGGSSAAKISEVAQGGWVSWCDSVNKIIYIPPEYSEGAAKMIGRGIVDNPELTMTIEEAKQYIDALK